MIIPVITLTIMPPNMTIRRCQAGLARNSQGCGSEANWAVSMDSSTMPEIFTNPPSGIAPMEYSVSPHWKPMIFGGKPMENFSTRMPKSLAVSKCPSSCSPTRIDNPRSSWPTIIKVSIYFDLSKFSVNSLDFRSVSM